MHTAHTTLTARTSVTLVPLDSALPSLGPFLCTEARMFPTEFYGYSYPSDDYTYLQFKEGTYAYVCEAILHEEVTSIDHAQRDTTGSPSTTLPTPTGPADLEAGQEGVS